MNRTLLVVLVAIAFFLSACGTGPDVTPTDLGEMDVPRADLDDLVEFVSRDWPTDWSSAQVDLDEFILGVSATHPLDAIPPIDEPVYESLIDAAVWLADREPGAVVQIEGDIRFHPLSILNRHEVVNTTIGDVPVAVTFCPLCNSAMTFDRRIDERTLRFGVSGLLRNSDLVLWDDATTSLWQQITGEALVGAYAGRSLVSLPTAIVSFGDLKREFPDASSLSRDTGFDLDYGFNPYSGYSGRFAPIMPVTGERDDRYPALERVVAVEHGEMRKAYPFSAVREVGAVNDFIDDHPVAVLWGSPDTADPLDSAVIADSTAIGTAIAFDPVVRGVALTFSKVGDGFVDNETGSSWSILGLAVTGSMSGERMEILTHRNDFWFAWSAFFPNGEVYDPDDSPSDGEP